MTVQVLTVRIRRVIPPVASLWLYWVTVGLLLDNLDERCAMVNEQIFKRTSGEHATDVLGLSP